MSVQLLCMPGVKAAHGLWHTAFAQGPLDRLGPSTTAVLGFAAATASRTRRVLQFHDRDFSSCI